MDSIRVCGCFSVVLLPCRQGRPRYHSIARRSGEKSGFLSSGLFYLDDRSSAPLGQHYIPPGISLDLSSLCRVSMFPVLCGPPAVHPGAWSQVFVTGLILLSLSRETYLRGRLPNLFYFQVQHVASNLFSILKHVDGIQSKEAVLIRGDVPNIEWTFLGNTFSRVYRLPRLEFAGGPPVAEEVGPGVLVLDYNKADDSFAVGQAKSIAPASGYSMNYSALEKLTGSLAPDPEISTPTRTHLFPMAGNGVSFMAAVAPLESRSRHRPVQKCLRIACRTLRDPPMA